MAFLFTKLKVYTKAIDLADRITEITGSFPKGTYYLSDQLNRAVLSISLNIAEGNGRYHLKDRQNFFRIARGSAFECVPILELCKRKNLIGRSQIESFLANLDEICKMLTGLINK
ncbi:MAG: four helix bundle protein [Proteobacteria bacterium]|nr:four helix bundle protein [Pseudomonadota bacterium]